MMKISPLLVVGFLGFLTSIPATAADVSLSLGPGGVALVAGAAGKFTLPAPKLIIEGGNPKGEEGVMEVVDEKTLSVKYVKAQATITLDAAAQSLTYTLVPQEGVKSLRVLMIIPISLAQGGKYSFGGKALKPLPAEKGEQFLEQTSAGEFVLVHSSNTGFKLTTPEISQELTDTRIFNMERFVYAAFLKAGTNDNKWTLKFSAYTPAPAATP